MSFSFYSTSEPPLPLKASHGVSFFSRVLQITILFRDSDKIKKPSCRFMWQRGHVIRSPALHIIHVIDGENAVAGGSETMRGTPTVPQRQLSKLLSWSQAGGE